MHPPRPLRPHDLVAIVAPSGPFPEDRYRLGVGALLARGYRVRELLPTQPRRYLAGDDGERLSLFHQAFLDPDVHAVFAARGGYGAMRLLDGIDWELVARSGKPLVGFSDITALHLALHTKGVKSIHGPVVTRIAEEPEASRERLFSLLEEAGRPSSIPGRVVVEGGAEGRLVGGCLSLLASLCGTPYLPNLDGCILFLEEVGERPYRIDRLLTQLRLSGALGGVAGIVLGDMTDCDDAEGPGVEVAEAILGRLGKPMLAGLPIGHGEKNLAVPHGARAAIREGALHFLEGIW